MKKIFFSIVATALSFLMPQTTVMASSHREAPLIAHDPQADNTDLYAFRSPCDSNKIIIIANYIPFEHPAGGPNWYGFGPNIRYEIHVKNRATGMADDITYRFTFNIVNEDTTTFFNIRLGLQNQKATYTCQRSMDGGSTWTTIISNGVVPPSNLGPRSITGGAGLGASSYSSLLTSAITTGSTGERVFCGPADDPFFVDLGGAFDVGGFRTPGRDGLAKFNCHSIAIEVPISTLQKTGLSVASATSILDPEFVIGVWASASRPAMATLSTSGAEPSTSGEWIQVSRIGMPLTNEVVIPIGSKDRWNGTNPYTGDLAFASHFKNLELALYMDTTAFALAVPGLSALRIQANSLGAFDFRNNKSGLWALKGSSAVAGTALDDAIFGTLLLPDSVSPRAVDILPIFYTGVPNLSPYQLATGKGGNPLAAGKPFINNFLPVLGDMLRLNMAVPVTPRTDPNFSSLGLIKAAVLGLTDPAYNTTTALQFIPNMDGFPNGRRLEDDVTTIELQAVSGVVLAAIGLWYDDYTGAGSPVTTMLTNVLGFNAGITHNDTTFKTCFPFVQDPWQSFNGSSYIGPVILETPITGVFTVCTGATTALSNTTSGGTWSSGSPAIATVSTTGVVTGVSAGTATISYTLAGTSVTTIVTVNSIPFVSSVTGASSLCAGTTTMLSTASTGGTWSSSNAAVATVGSTGIVAGISGGTAAISYRVTGACGIGYSVKIVNVISLPATISGAGIVCEGSMATLTSSPGGGMWSSDATGVATIVSGTGVVTGISSSTANITYTATSGCATTTIISVNPLPDAISGTAMTCIGNTTTLSSATSGGMWTSSNVTKATVGSGTGIVTGVGAGTVSISYTLPTGCRRKVTVTVSASPAPITGSLTVCSGSTSTLSSATTGGTWSSSDAATASVDAGTGIVTGTGTSGTAIITYTVGGCFRTAVVTVSTMLGANTGASLVCVGQSTDLNNPTTGGTWSSSNIAVASVSSSTGLVMGVSAGTTNISYRIGGGCYSITEVTVNASVASITGAATVCPGATTMLSNTTMGGVWSSSNIAKATVGAGTGLVTGVSAGTAIITYMVSSGCYKTKMITVSSAPGAIGGSALLCAGATTMLMSSPGGGTWSSAIPAIATVSATGLVTGISTGTVTISYQSGAGCAATREVTVTTAPGSISGTLSACIGSTTTLSAATIGGTWSSSNTAKATVGAGTGVVTGVSAGTATITYALSSTCRVTAVVTINATPGTIMGTLTLCASCSTTLSSATGGGMWSSSNTAVATIGAGTGVVSGVGVGTTTISYVAGGCVRTAVVTVSADIAPSTGTPLVCVGQTNATLGNPVSGGTWSSSNTSLATINASTGVLTGVAVGNPNITYTTSPGVYTIIVATVSAAVANITGTMAVCPGATITLSNATTGGTWSSSNTLKVTVGAGTGIVTGVTAGTATISYVVNVGCYKTTTQVVNTVPNVTGASSVVNGSSTTFGGSPGGGTWSSANATVASVSVAGVVTGNNVAATTISYTIGATGCFGTRSINVLASRPGDAGSNLSSSVLKVFPNPTSGTLTIEATTGGTFSVFTIEGKEVAQYTVATSSTIVSLPSNLAVGIYMCRFIGADGTSAIVRIVYER